MVGATKCTSVAAAKVRQKDDVAKAAPGVFDRHTGATADIGLP